jgi:hypothetical protein
VPKRNFLRSLDSHREDHCAFDDFVKDKRKPCQIGHEYRVSLRLRKVLSNFTLLEKPIGNRIDLQACRLVNGLGEKEELEA